MLRNETSGDFKMALSNAERQRKYRMLRNEKAKDADSYVAKIAELEAKIKTLIAERDLLRNENDFLRNNSRNAKPNHVKTQPFLTKEDAFFYVEGGELRLLQWPETVGTLKSRSIEPIPALKIDKKYAKTIDKQILEHNLEVEKNNQILIYGL